MTTVTTNTVKTSVSIYRNILNFFSRKEVELNSKYFSRFVCYQKEEFENSSNEFERMCFFHRIGLHTNLREEDVVVVFQLIKGIYEKDTLFFKNLLELCPTIIPKKKDYPGIRKFETDEEIQKWIQLIYGSMNITDDNYSFLGFFEKEPRRKVKGSGLSDDNDKGFMTITSILSLLNLTMVEEKSSEEETHEKKSVVVKKEKYHLYQKIFEYYIELEKESSSPKKYIRNNQYDNLKRLTEYENSLSEEMIQYMLYISHNRLGFHSSLPSYQISIIFDILKGMFIKSYDNFKELREMAEKSGVVLKKDLPSLRKDDTEKWVSMLEQVDCGELDDYTYSQTTFEKEPSIFFLNKNEIGFLTLEEMYSKLFIERIF